MVYLPSSNPFRWAIGTRVQVEYNDADGRIVERSGVIEHVYLWPGGQIVDVTHTDGTSHLYQVACVVGWYGGA